MTTTQTNAQSDLKIPQKAILGSDQISLEPNQVSVSQLLGRDYILIDDSQARLPLDNIGAMRNLFEALVKQLELAEMHTLAITFQQSPSGDIAFTRHDLEWLENSISRIESTFISDLEQQAFMSMLWQSSVPFTL